MPDTPDPAAIARRLTKAQREALMAMPESMAVSVDDMAFLLAGLVAWDALRAMIGHPDGLAEVRQVAPRVTIGLTSFGARVRVRAVLEQEARGDG